MLAASPGVNPMATWCKKCGQQDPRYAPYPSVRITEAEMRAYHHFLESCIRLECMAKKGTMREIMPFFYVFRHSAYSQWNNGLANKLYIKKFYFAMLPSVFRRI